MSPRRLEHELMDDPDLDPDLHRSALHALARLNTLSSADAPVWRALKPILDKSAPTTLLDVATGSGDLPVRLALRARTAGAALTVHACDLSPVAVDAARQRAASHDVPASFFTHDVIHNGMPGEYDVITCALFMHHLTETSAVALLQRMADAARRLLIVTDLRRSLTGLLLAAGASKLTTTSPIVRTDAVLSARAAFTIRELRALADRAGLTTARITRTWPARMTLIKAANA